MHDHDDESLQLFEAFWVLRSQSRDYSVLSAGPSIGQSKKKKKKKKKKIKIAPSISASIIVTRAVYKFVSC